MKNIKFLVLLVLMTMSANGMFADIFVNMKSPYVHLVYDSGLNEKVWKSVDGTVLATEKEAKPLADIDKGVYHDPRIKNQYVKKVWDNERGCYIYRSTTGDFLGRELPSESLEKQWLDSKDSNVPQNQLSQMIDKFRESNELFYEGLLNKDMPFVSKKAQAQLEGKGDGQEQETKALAEQDKAAEEAQWKKAAEEAQKQKAQKMEAEANKQMQKANADAARAQSEIEKAKAELHKLGMHDYDGLLNQASGQLKQAQSATKRRK